MTAPRDDTTFSPDPATFTFAPERFRCEGEGSGANLMLGALPFCQMGWATAGPPTTLTGSARTLGA